MANRAIRQFRDVRYASLGLTETKFIMLNYRWIFENVRYNPVDMIVNNEFWIYYYLSLFGLLLWFHDAHHHHRHGDNMILVIIIVCLCCALSTLHVSRAERSKESCEMDTSEDSDAFLSLSLSLFGLFPCCPLGLSLFSCGQHFSCRYHLSNLSFNGN